MEPIVRSPEAAADQLAPLCVKLVHAEIARKGFIVINRVDYEALVTLRVDLSKYVAAIQRTRTQTITPLMTWPSPPPPMERCVSGLVFHQPNQPCYNPRHGKTYS
jgi:hypothetical protein